MESIQIIFNILDGSVEDLMYDVGGSVYISKNVSQVSEEKSVAFSESKPPAS